MRLSLLLLVTSIGLCAADPTWTDVYAILDARCIECHGAAKQKSGLRLDTPEWIQHGSKDGAVVVAGKPTESKLYSMATLPEDHDDRMPPKGARLTEMQLTTLKNWIVAGASYTAATQTKDPATPIAVPAKSGVAVPIAPIVTDAAIEALKIQQIVVTKLAGGWLDINATHTKNGITTDQLELLAKTAPSTAYLDLAQTGLTDKQMTLLADYNKLRGLHLEGNPLSDAAALTLAKLSDLVYLNVVDTQLSDNGLSHLKALTNLEQLYVWKTKVTSAGIAELQKTLPHTKIVLGPDDLPTDPMTTGKGKRKKK